MIRRSKTDQDGFGQVIGVVTGGRPLTDPVAALMDWIEVRPAGAGRLFTRIHANGSATREPIGARTHNRMIQTRGRAVGFGHLPITGHSLWGGHTSTAAANGAGLDRIAAQTRHRAIETLVEHYIRPIDALANSTNRDLGL